MSESYDAVVIGAGPNGLSCGAYLARAGAKVAVIERCVETGGGLVTQELSGFRLNHHALYMMLAELMPPYQELDLSSRGVSFVRPEVQAAFLFEGGKSLTLHLDAAESRRSVEALCQADGERFAVMYEEFGAMCQRFLIPATYFPPIPPIEQTQLLETSGELGSRIAAFSEMSPREVIDEYGFEDPRVKAAFLYLGMMFGIDADEGGLGFLLPIYVYRLMNNAIVRGGSHQLSSALRRSLEEDGAEVITGTAVDEILMEDGRATGVRLGDGKEIRCRAVVSTLNPVQTFTKLVPEGTFPEEVEDGAREWEWEEWSLFMVNSGIVGEAPHYEGYDESVDEALMVVMGYECPEDVIAHSEAAKAGSVDHMAGHATVPSLFDPLQAPNHVPFGTPHVLRWETWAPYDRDWLSERDAFAERCMEFWAGYAPNLRERNTRVSVCWSPKDIETQLATMARGSIKHGAYTSLQMGYNRPLPDCSEYTTPVDGLFVAGASTHPGGMVIMGPGYNASRAVASALGIELPWPQLDSVRLACERGYLSLDALAEDAALPEEDE